LTEISIFSRIYVACRSLIEYLRLLVWPSDLSTLYDHPGNSIAIGSFAWWWPVVGIMLVTVIAIVAALRGKRWSAAWFCFAVLLLPVLGFAQNGGQSMADRFTYLPSLAPTILVAASITHFLQREAAVGRSRFALPVVIALTLVAATFLAVTSRGLIGAWHDTESLWTRAITARPSEAGRAYYFRGVEYQKKGEYRAALEDANNALAILERIGYTRVAKVYELRAAAYEGLGMMEQAARDQSFSRTLPSPWAPVDTTLSHPGASGASRGTSGIPPR
jgi:protein O-mannosyl-transferase